MNTKAQGDGNRRARTRLQPPSLLGLAIGAPYLHAGNARTLEALFGRPSALTPGARAELPNRDRSGRGEEQDSSSAQYLLSIDEDTAYVTIPGAGAAGGALCPNTF